MANFEGKTVIVTGGGGGIGGATSKRFAADGAKVAVFDMNVEAAQKVVDEIKSKITAASQPGVDKTKINKEIEQLKKEKLALKDQLYTLLKQASA